MIAEHLPHILNLAVCVVLLTVPLWFSRRYLRLPALNPLTITMAVWLPVEVMKLFVGPLLLIDGGLWDAGFQYAVLMNNVLVISQTAGLVVAFRVASTLRIERFTPFRSLHLSPKVLRKASYFFLLLFAFAFYRLASAEFGVLNWIINPRTGYQLYRVGQGHWYALAISAISVAALLSYLAKPVARVVLLKSAAFIATTYLFGSKGVMLAHFTASLIVLWFIGWPHVGKLFLIGGPIVFAAMAWNLYLALGDSFELLSLVNYFDYYVNAAMYYRGILNGEVHLFGGEVFFSSLWAYVPRGFVPDKPFVYGVVHVNEIFFPGAAELTNTPAFGGAVEQYADFGVLGVIVFGFFSGQAILNALLSYLVFRAPGLTPSRVTLAALLALIAMAGPNFGAFFPGILYWTLLFAVGVAIRTSRFKFIWSSQLPKTR